MIDACMLWQMFLVMNILTNVLTYLHKNLLRLSDLESEFPLHVLKLLWIAVFKGPLLVQKALVVTHDPGLVLSTAVYSSYRNDFRTEVVFLEFVYLSLYQISQRKSGL